jgi:hypothetical protein
MKLEDKFGWVAEASIEDVSRKLKLVETINIDLRNIKNAEKEKGDEAI